MARLTLYYAPRSRAFRGLWMLEELGEPYDIRLVDIDRGEQKSAAYLAINPAGKVPALRDGDTMVTESAAICTYLADRYPAAELAPAVNAPDRGAYLNWMFYAVGCMEPAVLAQAREWDVPARQAAWGDYRTMLDVVARGLSRGPYLLGDRFSAADVMVGSNLHFCLQFDLMPKRPEFVTYVERLEDRPAFQRANAIEAERGHTKISA